MIGAFIYAYVVLSNLSVFAGFIGIFAIIYLVSLFLVLHEERDGLEDFSKKSKKPICLAFFMFFFVCLIPDRTETAVIVGSQLAADSKVISELNSATGIGAEYIKELLKHELIELKNKNIKGDS